jgi:hypothetical protein
MEEELDEDDVMGAAGVEKIRDVVHRRVAGGRRTASRT